MLTTFKRIWMPGFLFQGVLIGGGYATGRELVEFFLSQGPMAGLLGLILASAGFSLILALSFELARVTRSYDYRSFFKQILGPLWFLFEIAFLALAVLILAVLGAASGELVSAHLGIPKTAGIVGMIIVIGILVFHGNWLVEGVLAFWSFLLYLVYGLMLVMFWYRTGFSPAEVFSSPAESNAWIGSSLRYVGYNMAAITMILFCVRHMESRRDAILAGLLGGPLGMIPAFLFYVCMAASFPEIVDVPVPADYVFSNLGYPWMMLLFYVVVFGTFVETGTALIHSINERMGRVFEEKGKLMPRWLRPAVATVALFFAVYLAGAMGIVDLIARGYGTMAYVFVAVILLPLLTVGLHRIFRGVDES